MLLETSISDMCMLSSGKWPRTFVIFGCKIGVTNLTSGGFLGNPSPSSIYKTNVPFSYGDSGGPCIITFQKPIFLSLTYTSMNSCWLSIMALISLRNMRPAPEAPEAGVAPLFIVLPPQLVPEKVDALEEWTMLPTRLECIEIAER